MYVADYASPLGNIKLAGDENGLAGLWFAGQNNSPQEDDFEPVGVNDVSVIKNTVRCLDLYFKGENPNFDDLPLCLQGSGFRKCVWKILSEIPYGKTVTYSDVSSEHSQRYGFGRMSAQAVGNAISHNPILIIIPCHRVIGKDGTLKGYSAGIERKKELLNLEADLAKNIFLCF